MQINLEEQDYKIIVNALENYHWDIEHREEGYGNPSLEYIDRVRRLGIFIVEYIRINAKWTHKDAD